MSPKKFKSDVKVAYEQAIRNNSRSVEYVDNTHPIFDGVRVFGRDAGIDQIQTSIDGVDGSCSRRCAGA